MTHHLLALKYITPVKLTSIRHSHQPIHPINGLVIRIIDSEDVGYTEHKFLFFVAWKKRSQRVNPNLPFSTFAIK
jgi:hypothetical protein